MDLFDKCRVEIVEKATAENVYPYFHQIESKQAPEVIMEGSRRIMLGSNNYLGLTSNPDVIAAGVRALEKYGSGCSGSRFLNGTLDLHVQLESELADFLNKEDVMTFSTGFQSNLGIISAIAGRGDYIFCDKENHASIYDGCKLSYAKTIRFNHSDMAHLETALQSVPLESGKLIVTDGVFSMGGYMAGDKRVVNYVRHASRPFIFCASIPPANCATAIESLHILRSHPEMPKRLVELAAYMRKGLLERGIAIRDSITPIIPIYTYDEMRTLRKAKELFDAGVYVNPVLPPATPPGESLLRTSYMANHTETILDEALDIIERIVKND